MGNIKCSQCGYYESNNTNGLQCSRYCIPVDKDNKCVDCDESEDKNYDMMG